MASTPPSASSSSALAIVGSDPQPTSPLPPSSPVLPVSESKSVATPPPPDLGYALPYGWTRDELTVLAADISALMDKCEEEEDEMDDIRVIVNLLLVFVGVRQAAEFSFSDAHKLGFFRTDRSLPFQRMMTSISNAEIKLAKEANSSTFWFSADTKHPQLVKYRQATRDAIPVGCPDAIDIDRIPIITNYEYGELLGFTCPLKEMPSLDELKTSSALRLNSLEYTRNNDYTIQIIGFYSKSTSPSPCTATCTCEHHIALKYLVDVANKANYYFSMMGIDGRFSIHQSDPKPFS